MMPLTKLDREVITDSILKIQSIQTSLDQLEDAKLGNIDEINSCLKSANESFRDALRNGSEGERQVKPPAKSKPEGQSQIS
jgi:hypothetical protein